MSQRSDASASVEFGRFTLLPLRRELLSDGVPIELGGRAFDVLMALIEANGTVLSKVDLIGRVWQGRVVEENNLQVQIAALRKALAADRGLVRTVAGRGYQFVGEVRAVTVASTAAPVPAPPKPGSLLPPVTELIGRGAELDEATNLVRAHRLVTLSGSGGIGKTRLSFEVAHQLVPTFTDGVWIAELGSLSDPELVPVTVATALGLPPPAGRLSPEWVAAAVRVKHLLLVLDNCEHVIEAAARMAETLLRVSPAVSVLATSREPLRSPGEYVFRVPPLEVPAEGAEDRDTILRSGAVKLFVARACAADPHFALDQHAVAILAVVCRRLDGIPLAIELAAARTAALGVGGLAARIDDRFRLLAGGHRTALPRQQTLRATLDWSYDLLPECERVVFRRLAVFAGGFTLESASAALTSPDIGALDVVDCIANLFSKSLITAVGSAAAHYRLLETTRAYALEKLTESGEFDRFARRHAEHYQRVFEAAAAEWEVRPTAEWLATHGPELDNVRAALDWAYSSTGDSEIGLGLTVSAVPLWMHLSMVEECRVRVEHALASLGADLTRGTRKSMQLYAAQGLSLMYTKGAAPETRAALTRALQIAEMFDDTDYQLRALWGLCVDRLNNGIFREALAFAERFRTMASESSDPVDVPIGDQMVGLSLHYLGDQMGARRHLDRMLNRYVAPVRRSHIIRFQFDQRVTAHVALAMILWLQGYPDQAMRAVERNVEQASELNHELSLCNALAKACPVALLTGDLGAAQRFVGKLVHYSARHALASWHAEGRCFEGVLLVKRGDLDSGVRVLRGALGELPGINFSLRYTALLGELAEALGRSGQVAEGVEAINEALARSDNNEERWCIAELLRVKAELSLIGGAPDAPVTAEADFLQGLGWARHQGALSWELRCATGLARLWHSQGQRSRARELLAPVYHKFAEGFGTADVVAAKATLEALE